MKGQHYHGWKRGWSEDRRVRVTRNELIRAAIPAITEELRELIAKAEHRVEELKRLVRQAEAAQFLEEQGFELPKGLFDHLNELVGPTDDQEEPREAQRATA